MDFGTKSAAFMAALLGIGTWALSPHARDVHLKPHFEAAVRGVWTRTPGFNYNS